MNLRNANGNTTNSGGLGYVYDFENRLIQKGGLTIVYDGDGNRVSKTIAGATTTYLVDDRNPTGYAQVVAENPPNNNTSYYVYGLERISRRRVFYDAVKGWVNERLYFVYDGHGSVRALTDQTGAITDTYDYDAFGNLIRSTGSTPNNYLFAGEQFDPDLALYYNRARYLNTSTGRFWTVDTADPGLFDPLSLHRYLHANGDPVNRSDPSGEQASIAEADAEIALSITLATMATVVLTTALHDAKVETGMRLNHYTQWVNIPLIMLFGFDNPIPPYKIYFTPDFYLTGSEAKASLAMRVKPQVIINLTVYRYGDDLSGPSRVLPFNGEPGGGQEYWTPLKVPFWTRWPILLPLEEELNLMKPYGGSPY